MAVYREGYAIIEEYDKKQVQVFNDSADCGVLVKKDDKMWNMMKQLVDWYGNKETRSILTPNQVQIEVTLMDEWALSDERKTIKEATDKFTVLYYKFRRNDLNSLIHRGYDGFFTITKN